MAQTICIQLELLSQEKAWTFISHYWIVDYSSLISEDGYSEFKTEIFKLYSRRAGFKNYPWKRSDSRVSRELCGMKQPPLGRQLVLRLDHCVHYLGVDKLFFFKWNSTIWNRNCQIVIEIIFIIYDPTSCVMSKGASGGVMVSKLD